MDSSIGHVIFSKEITLAETKVEIHKAIVPTVVVSVIALLTIAVAAVLLIKRRRLLKLNSALSTKYSDRKKAIHMSYLDVLFNGPYIVPLYQLNILL